MKKLLTFVALVVALAYTQSSNAQCCVARCVVRAPRAAAVVIGRVVAPRYRVYSAMSCDPCAPALAVAPCEPIATVDDYLPEPCAPAAVDQEPLTRPQPIRSTVRSICPGGRCPLK